MSTQKHPRNDPSPKVGSDPDAVHDFGGKGDFGVPAGGERTADRDYVSRNTKASDPGASHARASEHDGVRDHGAGANDSGPGSSSGGDLDTDIIGVGTDGAGVSASGSVHEPAGPDDTDGRPGVFSSAPPRRPEVIPARGKGFEGAQAQGAAVNPDLADNAEPTKEGADSVTNPARDDDSFAGEISSGEARGEDGPMH